MNETWEVIPGYNGRYEASTLGRIRRVSGKGTLKGPKLLRTFVGDYGYIRTAIIRKGKVYKPGVHVLVALAFLGKCPEGYEVNHIDLDKSNNCLSNLEYLTHKQNHQHVRARKMWDTGKANRRLTDDQVREIRASSESQRVLGNKYGLAGVAIWQIRHYKTYKDVK